MDENQKMKVAAFRFGIICDFVNGARLEHGQREKLLQEKCARKWAIPFSVKTSISRSTIQRWIELYENGNSKLDCLYPHDRNDKGKSRTIDEETQLALILLTYISHAMKKI